MYTLSQLFTGFCILIEYLYIFVMNLWFECGEFQLTKISHYLQFLWLSLFKEILDLKNNILTGTLPTEMGNMNQLDKLLCTHCLNSLMDFVFCMNIYISLLCIYDLNMESVNWSKHLTTCKSCGFLFSKFGCIWKITNWRVHFPLKWETWMNLVSYCIHILLIL